MRTTTEGFETKSIGFSERQCQWSWRSLGRTRVLVASSPRAANFISCAYIASRCYLGALPWPPKSAKSWHEVKHAKRKVRVQVTRWDSRYSGVLVQRPGKAWLRGSGEQHHGFSARQHCRRVELDNGHGSFNVEHRRGCNNWCQYGHDWRSAGDLP